MSRTAIVVWILAVSHMDSGAAESITNMTVSVGQSVMLPCPCSEDTERLVWQIGEEIVVNHCCEPNDTINESYRTRTQVFMSSTKGNCSLLLRNVSLNDSKTFTCYIFNHMNILRDPHEVQLTVKDENAPTPSHLNDPTTRFSVGVPLSLIVVLLAVLVLTLFIRRQRQKRPKMVVIQDPQSNLPMMDVTHV